MSLGLIPITGVPASYLVPGGYLELNFNQGPGTTASGERSVLFVAPMTASGTWTAATRYGPINNEQQVIDGAGPGSMCHRMYRAFTYKNTKAKVYIIPIAATSAGAPVAGTFDVTIATVPTATGTAEICVCGSGFNGCKATYTYDTSDTVTTIADGLVAAINAATHLPVTASNVAGLITITARIAGASQGNGTIKPIYCRTSITTGTGTTITASGHVGDTVAGADGTTTEAANLLAALNTITGVRHYWMGTSEMDATNTGAGSLETHITNKSEPRPGLRSSGVVAYCGTQATGETAALARNYERIRVVHQEGSDHDAAHLVGAYLALLQEGYETDATNNLNGTRLDLYGIDPAYAVSDWPDDDDQQDALYDGLISIASDENGAYLVKDVTTRSKDTTGTYSDLRSWSGHVVSGADRFCDDLLVWHGTTFQGYKLMDDPDPEQIGKLPPKTVTPLLMTRGIKGIYDRHGPEGLNNLQQIDTDKEAIRCVISTDKRSRLACHLNVHVIGMHDQTTFQVDEVSAA